MTSESLPRSGFAQKKVDVLRHDGVTGRETPVPAANALQFLLKSISGSWGIQQLHAVIAAKGNEAQAALALVAN